MYEFLLNSNTFSMKKTLLFVLENGEFIIWIYMRDFIFITLVF